MKPKINELDITLGTAVELTRQVLALPSGWPRVQALHQIGAARKDLCVSLSYTGWGALLGWHIDSFRGRS